MNTTTLLPHHLSSAYALVKALKSTSSVDTPALSKLDIATRALADQTVYLPNRYQIIQDWVVDSWLDTKSSSAILDPAQHRLFLATTPHARPAVQIGPILLRFLNGVKKSRQSLPRDLIPLVLASFRQLSHFDRRPARPEIWTTVWVELLECWSSTVLPDDWMEVYRFVVQEYRVESTDDSLKKLSLALRPSLATYLSLRLSHPLIQSLDSIIVQYLLPWTSLVGSDPLGFIPGTVNPALVSFLPCILREYILLLQRERYRIYNQPSSSREAIDVYLANRLRSSVCSVLTRCFEAIRPLGESASALQGHADLWSQIEAWGGYLETEPDWRGLLERSSALAQGALRNDDTARKVALELLVVLETIDHQTAAIGPDVMEWCLACPVDARPNAERLLVGLVTYHSLTRSLDSLFELLDRACLSLIRGADSHKSTRAVYALIAEGPLASFPVRSALSNHRVALDAQRVVHLLVSRMAADKTDDTRAIEETTRRAAMLGLRSRMIKVLLVSEPLDEDLYRPISARYPAESRHTSKRAKWASQIEEAAWLRLWNLRGGRMPRDEAPHCSVMDASTLPETRAELIIHQIRHVQTLPAESIEATISLDELQRLLRDAGLARALGCHLSETQWVQIFTTMGERFTPNAELQENLLFQGALDRYVSDDVAHGRWLSLASADVQRAAFRTLLKSGQACSADVLDWLQHALTMDDMTSLFAEKAVLEACCARLIKLDLPRSLLRDIFSRASLRSLDPTIQAMLDHPDLIPTEVVSRLVNGSHSLAESTCIFLEAIVSGNVEGISPSSRVRLTDTLCAIAEGVDGVLNTPIGVNHASLSLVSALDNAGRWLGLEIRLANLAAVFESTDWSNVDVETVVMALGVAQRRRMLNQKQDSLVASTIARSVAARQSDPLRQTVRLLDKSQVGQTLEEVARAVVTKCSKGAIWLLCELLELDTPAIRDAVRDQGTHLLQTIKFAPILTSLRGFLYRNPYALGSRDVIALLKSMSARLLQSDGASAFTGVISIVITLLRHRRDTALQHPTVLIDICHASFPLFVSRTRNRSSLTTEHAAHFSRFLSLMGSDKDSNTSALVKHLPAVLLEYVRAVSDPRGSIAFDVRQELKQGLAGICDLVTAGGRVQSRGREGESLGEAFGLGDGSGADAEKEVWADLWQTWSSKRYVGQG